LFLSALTRSTELRAIEYNLGEIAIYVIDGKMLLLNFRHDFRWNDHVIVA
jgi:hypothetical protein